MKLKTIDLFAGVGGIRLGFEKSDFETVFANDFEPKCQTTYNLNFDNTKLTIKDLKEVNGLELPDFDFLLGGFPCQAFSIAGYRQGFEDTKGKGDLFFYVAKILEQKQPMGFMLENVKNLVGHDNGKTFRVILQTLESLGYNIKCKVINTMEYGNVPQNRERIYIVGFKDKAYFDNFDFPKPIALTRTIQDMLEDEVDQKYYYEGKQKYALSNINC